MASGTETLPSTRWPDSRAFLILDTRRRAIRLCSGVTRLAQPHDRVGLVERVNLLPGTSKTLPQSQRHCHQYPGVPRFGSPEARPITVRSPNRRLARSWYGALVRF